ncbi:hypothetical protein C8R46DRAFT_1029153 [Mycena filopes]|nr:hypothetical protein C8R46DRAFT_1029153 [Mycena filopes]
MSHHDDAQPWKLYHFCVQQFRSYVIFDGNRVLRPTHSFPTLQQQGRKFRGRSFKLKNGTHVKLEDLYLVPRHPLRQGIRGKTYVYYQDTSEAGLSATWKQEKQLETPQGTCDRLTDGDNPEKDVIQIWVADGELFTAEMKKNLDDERDRVLGPRSERNRKRPKDGKGGTAYERTPLARSVKEPARVYTLLSTVESQTGKEHPVAVAKGVTDSALKARSGLAAAVTAFSMASMDQAPEPTKHAICERAEIMLKPAVGARNNWAQSTQQLNLAACKRRCDACKKSGALSGDLGFFGGAHVDRNDAEAWYTNMTCNHDIPDNYDPGMFFILQLGVFVRLKRYSSINFFGHRKHGGTPPLCPDGVTPVKWGYRFVVVSYPPRRTVNGTSRVVLAALPHNQSLVLPPEVLHIGCQNRVDAHWSDPPTTNASTFVKEGADIMEPVSLVQMVVCWGILFLFYLLKQLPERFKVQMDPDLIIQAITYETEDGERRNVGPWALAPGHRRTDQGKWNYHTGGGERTDQDAVRSQSWVDWQAYEDHVVMHVPHLGRKGIVPAVFPKQPKKTAIMQNPSNSDADDEESATDSDADSDDEQVQQERAARAKRRVLRETAAKARAAVVKALKLANKKPRVQKKKPEPEPETETGVSEEDEEVVPPVAADAVTARAARWEARNQKQTSESQPSEKSLGKRKEVPLPDLGHAVAESVEKLDHSSGDVPRAKKAKTWSTVAALTTMDEAPVVRSSGSTRVLRSGSAFGLRITVSSIGTTLEDVEDACLIIASRPQDGALGIELTSLRRVFEAVEAVPNAVETPALISGLWPQLLEMAGHEASVALSRRLLHHQIMITNCWAWGWLDGHCSQEIAAALVPEAVPAHWIHNVAVDAKNVLENRTTAKDFDSTAYGLPFAAIYNFRITAPRFIAADDLASEVVQLATKIIASWVHFPLDTTSRYQAWFARSICSTWGEEALLLDEVWDSYSHIRRAVLGDANGKNAVQLLTEFQAELYSHPLSNPHTSEAKLLRNISGLLQEVTRKDLQYQPIAQTEPAGVDVDMSPLKLPPSHQTPSLPSNEDSAPPEDAPSDDGLGGADRKANDDDVASDSDSDSEATSASYLSLTQDQRQKEFLRFLREAANASSAAHPNNFQKQIVERMDYIYPFREGAPSRQRVSAENGPFTAARIRTDAGMLSALIFRAITFRTGFLADRRYPTFFTDIAHFHQVKAAATLDYVREHDGAHPPAKYFCLADAYGPFNARKVVGLADEYAQTLALDSWAAKFGNRQEIPFSDCFDWLSGFLQEPGKRPGSMRNSKRRRFPVLGPLASYLLTADLVHAGAVTAPTADEMGSTIHFLNKGAVSGLEILGLITGRGGQCQEVEREAEGVFKSRCEGVSNRVREAVSRSLQNT